MAPPADVTPPSARASLIRVRASGADDRPFVARAARETLGSERQVYLARGPFDVTDFPALIAEFDGAEVGFLAWEIEGDDAEVVALACTERGIGAGGALMAAFHDLARAAGCETVSLITTDHNEAARGFYEHLGYTVAAVRLGAVDECRRRFKPEIPEDAHDEILYRRPLVGS